MFFIVFISIILMATEELMKCRFLYENFPLGAFILVQVFLIL